MPTEQFNMPTADGMRLRLTPSTALQPLVEKLSGTTAFARRDARGV